MSHWAGPAPGAGPDVSLLAWHFDPLAVAPVVVTAAIYLRGWRIASARMPGRCAKRQLVAMLAGLATIVLALASPLDALSPRLLLAHMTQHLLIMTVAPPLLWMGAPVAPLLLGLPRPGRRV